MARLKRTVVQRSFTFMELREDFLERDDVEPRAQSLKGARNMRALHTGAMEARPGLSHVRTLAGADDIIEIRPQTNLEFGMVIFDNRLQVLDELGDVVFTQTPVPWTDAQDVWHNAFRDKVVIGSESGGIHMLAYENGAWSFTEFAFSEIAGGEIAQPYWSYIQDATIQPSATTGTITVTASKAIWTDDYVGQRIRYGLREILISERISGTVLRGDVVSDLPPSFRITVQGAAGFSVGDAVISDTTNFQGIIAGIAGNELDVITQAFFEGPDVGEQLSAPSGTSEVTAKATLTPLASAVWDEPLMSPIRGWPRASGSAAGRLVLVDFPAIPDLVACSSSRKIEDFKVGAQDDDAIVRQVGNSAPRWLHAVSLGDLILFSDNGIYNVPTRENGIISPSTFNPVFIDESGCSLISPVKVEDGIVFVDSSGENVRIVMLDGNIYLKWSVRSMTEMHRHLIKSPRSLCGPSLASSSAEKYVFVINADGTVAAVSWRARIRDENVGFAPWDTSGNFINISPIFGGYWAIVDRQVGGSTVRFLERFDNDMKVDCGVESDTLTATQMLEVNGEDLEVNGELLVVTVPYMQHLAGETVAYYIAGWDAGDFVVNEDGTIDNEPTAGSTRQVGLNFVCEASPWPVEIVESTRIGDISVRVMQIMVSVQDTLGFEVLCNGVANRISAYGFGDDLDAPPTPKTKVYRFSVYGSRDHPEMIISKMRPGPFRILAIGQKVQA